MNFPQANARPTIQDYDPQPVNSGPVVVVAVALMALLMIVGVSAQKVTDHYAATALVEAHQ